MYWIIPKPSCGFTKTLAKFHQIIVMSLFVIWRGVERAGDKIGLLHSPEKRHFPSSWVSRSQITWLLCRAVSSAALSPFTLFQIIKPYHLCSILSYNDLIFPTASFIYWTKVLNRIQLRNRKQTSYFNQGWFIQGMIK